MNGARIFPTIIAGSLAVVTAIVGGTITVLDDWYYSLEQPAWAPPDDMFGIIWTAIFAMIAVSGVLAWEKAPTRRESETIGGISLSVHKIRALEQRRLRPPGTSYGRGG